MRPVGVELFRADRQRADRRTDVTKIIVAFSNFRLKRLNLDLYL